MLRVEARRRNLGLCEVGPGCDSVYGVHSPIHINLPVFTISYHPPFSGTCAADSLQPGPHLSSQEDADWKLQGVTSVPGNVWAEEKSSGLGFEG